MSYARFAYALAASLLLTGAALAQESSTPAENTPSDADTTTIRGCLKGERGNYIVVEKSGSVFVLKGVGNKLDSHLNHMVEVKGQMLPEPSRLASGRKKPAAARAIPYMGSMAPRFR